MADNNNNTENQLQYQNANNILVVQEVYQVDVEYTIQVEKNKTEKEKKYKSSKRNSGDACTDSLDNPKVVIAASIILIILFIVDMGGLII